MMFLFMTMGLLRATSGSQISLGSSVYRRVDRSVTLRVVGIEDGTICTLSDGTFAHGSQLVSTFRSGGCLRCGRKPLENVEFRDGHVDIPGCRKADCGPRTDIIYVLNELRSAYRKQDKLKLDDYANKKWLKKESKHLLGIAHTRREKDGTPIFDLKEIILAYRLFDKKMLEIYFVIDQGFYDELLKIVRIEPYRGGRRNRGDRHKKEQVPRDEGRDPKTRLTTLEWRCTCGWINENGSQTCQAPWYLDVCQGKRFWRCKKGHSNEHSAKTCTTLKNSVLCGLRRPAQRRRCRLLESHDAGFAM